MAKQKSDKLFFHLRVTEHRDLKGDRDLKNRKIKKYRVRKEKIHVVVRDPKNPSIVLQDYHTTVKAYQTRYNEGNVIRWSTSYYAKNEAEVKVLLGRSIKRNKRTRRTDISAVSQMVQGEVTDRYRSFLKQGSKISRSAKFGNTMRTANSVKKSNREKIFNAMLSRLELDYALIGSPKKRHDKKKKGVVVQSKKQKEFIKGRFRLTFDEREAQKKFKPRKVKRSEHLQKRRMKRK